MVTLVIKKKQVKREYVISIFSFAITTLWTLDAFQNNANFTDSIKIFNRIMALFFQLLIVCIYKLNENSLDHDSRNFYRLMCQISIIVKIQTICIHNDILQMFLYSEWRVIPRKYQIVFSIMQFIFYSIALFYMYITVSGLYRSYELIIDSIKMWFRKRKLRYIYNTKTDQKSLIDFAEPYYITNPIGYLEYDALERDFVIKNEVFDNQDPCDDLSCSICMEELVKETKSRSKQAIYLPICQHKFHKSCVFKWFGINKETCPYCRSNLKSNLLQHYHPDDYKLFLNRAYTNWYNY